MIAAAFAIPGNIDLPTGGYTYDRRVLALLPANGVAARHVRLPDGFPNPSSGDLEETRRLLLALPRPAVLLIDGLAYGAMPAGLIQSLQNPIIALVHHPLCLEAGVPKPRQDELYGLEKEALALARRVIVSSSTTAATLMADFAVPSSKITVAEPGTDPAARATGTGTPLQLLAVGSIVPRKAYDVLVRALAPPAGRDWQLTIVGLTDRSAEAIAALRAAIQETGLAQRITLAGPADKERLDTFYAAADAFLMPSLYEGYGMVLAEAMARGLPIVCTTGGAAASTVPEAAALKVRPGDVAALSEAVRLILDDTSLRRRLSDAAWGAGRGLPRWDATARIIAGVMRDIAS
jgi:glycosyltransferase involved in cell wall biosynthesis